MPGKKRRIAVGGRYDERVIAARIDSYRRERGMEIKEFCTRIGWGKWDYTRKIKQAITPMDVWEYNMAAEILRMPYGAPFIDTVIAERIQRWLDTGGASEEHTHALENGEQPKGGAGRRRA